MMTTQRTVQASLSQFLHPSDDLQSCMDSLAPTSHIVLFNASHILPIYSLSIIGNLVDNKLIDMSAVEYVLPKHVTN